MPLCFCVYFAVLVKILYAGYSLKKRGEIQKLSSEDPKIGGKRRCFGVQIKKLYRNICVQYTYGKFFLSYNPKDFKNRSDSTAVCEALNKALNDQLYLQFLVRKVGHFIL
jgi:hypothetical protein